MGERTLHVEAGDLGATLESLAATIHGRWGHDPHESYTALLLTSPEDKRLKKVAEEAVEVVMQPRITTMTMCAMRQPISFIT